jgi:hypothetical protein
LDKKNVENSVPIISTNVPVNSTTTTFDNVAGIALPDPLEDGNEPADGVGNISPVGTIVHNQIQEGLCSRLYKRERGKINHNMDPS